MNKKLHIVNFTVEAENEEPEGKQDDGGEDGGDNDHKGKDEEEDDLYETDDDDIPKKDPSSSTSSSMKTPVTKPNSTSGCKTVKVMMLEDPFDQEQQLKDIMGKSVPPTDKVCGELV